MKKCAKSGAIAGQSLRLCAVFLTLATLSWPSHAAENSNAAALSKMLKSGGHVIYIRHTSTEKDYADQISAVMGNCATQRSLSEKGWKEAETIGAAFQLLDIPVGAVYSSEYCRAWQTARIAFGSSQKLADLNFEPAEEYSDVQVAKMAGRIKPMLATHPAAGTNTIIVGHDDPFEAATGIYPKPQGVAYILKPRGSETFEIVGHVRPGDWKDAIASR